LNNFRESSGFEADSPDDREKSRNAAKEARETERRTVLEYRFRHNNGNWMVLEIRCQRHPQRKRGGPKNL